jgi:hypothetical protein
MASWLGSGTGVTLSDAMGQSRRIPSIREMSGLPPITAEIADIKAAYLI